MNMANRKVAWLLFTSPRAKLARPAVVTTDQLVVMSSRWR